MFGAVTMFILLIAITIFYRVIDASSNTNFTILTEECKIPYFPSFSEEANKVFAAQNYTSCTKSDLLTFVTVKNNTAFLHLDEENEIYDTSEEPPTCCYSYVTRNGTDEEPDVGISKSQCTPFNSTLELEGDTILVKCERNSEMVYENVHSPITITEEVQTKLQEQPITDNNQTMSVLILVIDSVSRLNFNRSMPRTRKALLQNGFIDFIAYNKVDDNTFPNSMALLAGLNLKQVYSMCHPRYVGNLDKCPMIWYDFRNLGYVTAYAEDWAQISTFNYQRKGFQNPPTDYYFKPYVEAAETLNKTWKDGMLYCTGPETEGERILNLAKDFAITFKNKPSFGIFWMNTFSHNNISTPSGMDEKVENFFQELHGNGILNDSLVMVLSDHGIRFGNFRQTIQGWFEERLPLNFISFPWRLKQTLLKEYNNMKYNSKRLVSTYDLYMTLQDVLKMSVNNYTVTPSLACPKCHSLFSRIRNRSCKEAGIPEAWCTCVGEFTTNDPRITEKVKYTASKLALKEISRWLEHQHPFSTSVVKIISSAINVNKLRKSYLLFVVQTDTGAIYQILFRVRGDPIKFVRIVKAMRLS